MVYSSTFTGMTIVQNFPKKTTTTTTTSSSSSRNNNNNNNNKLWNIYSCKQ